MEIWRFFIVAGVCLILVGVVLYVLPKGFHPCAWFGSLPGDVAFKTDHTKVFIPIASMIVVSLVLSAASWLIQKMLR
jgi:hypothetical protein